MLKLLNSEKLIAGIDISDDYTQVSYCTLDHVDQIETLSMTAGVEKFNIPTVICKKNKVNQWLIGKEALRYADENKTLLIKNLLELAFAGQPVTVEGANVDPGVLLSMFLKKCFSMLLKMKQADRIEAIMFTVQNPDKRLKEILAKAVNIMKFREDRIFFQSYSESFYCYMLSQPREMWNHTVVLFEYDDGQMRIKKLHCNRERTPAVVYINESVQPFLAYNVGDRDKSLKEELERMDLGFLKLCTDEIKEAEISSIFLIGEEFSTEWMEESLKYLCEKGRVFQGSNLYGKGACYGLAGKLKPVEEDEDFVFMGADKLKVNIGMKLFDRGKERYYAIFGAGTSWYDADKTFEVYIREGNQIDIMIASVIGKGNKLAQIILEELTGKISRLKIHMYLTEEEKLTVEIEDMGLGTMRPGTHNLWKEEISI